MAPRGKAPQELQNSQNLPRFENLPPRGFFLHAAWLQSNKIAGMENGIQAPLPAHFLK
jgi:hypothetical protein